MNRLLTASSDMAKRPAEAGAPTTVKFNVEGAVISVALDRPTASRDPREALEEARSAVFRLAERRTEQAANAASGPAVRKECPNTFALWAYRR